MRSTLAGVAEMGLNVPSLCKGRGTTKWWKGFASVRSTLAGLAERGCKKKQSLTACGGAPFTQGSLFLIKSRLCRASSLPSSLFSPRSGLFRRDACKRSHKPKNPLPRFRAGEGFFHSISQFFLSLIAACAE